SAGPWLTGRHKVIEQSVDKVFVKNTLIPKALQIKFQRFELDAAFGRRVSECNLSKIGLPCLRTKARELRADDFDGIVPAGVLIGECLQLVGRWRFRFRHDRTSPQKLSFHCNHFSVASGYPSNLQSSIYQLKCSSSGSKNRAVLLNPANQGISPMPTDP